MDGWMTDSAVICPVESGRTDMHRRLCISISSTMRYVMELEFLTDRLRINKSGTRASFCTSTSSIVVGGGIGLAGAVEAERGMLGMLYNACLKAA